MPKVDDNSLNMQSYIKLAWLNSGMSTSEILELTKKNMQTNKEVLLGNLIEQEGLLSKQAIETFQDILFKSKHTSVSSPPKYTDDQKKLLAELNEQKKLIENKKEQYRKIVLKLIHEMYQYLRPHKKENLKHGALLLYNKVMDGSKHGVKKFFKNTNRIYAGKFLEITNAIDKLNDKRSEIYEKEQRIKTDNPQAPKQTNTSTNYIKNQLQNEEIIKKIILAAEKTKVIADIRDNLAQYNETYKDNERQINDYTRQLRGIKESLQERKTAYNNAVVKHLGKDSSLLQDLNVKQANIEAIQNSIAKCTTKINKLKQENQKLCDEEFQNYLDPNLEFNPTSLSQEIKRIILHRSYQVSTAEMQFLMLHLLNEHSQQNPIPPTTDACLEVFALTRAEYNPLQVQNNKNLNPSLANRVQTFINNKNKNKLVIAVRQTLQGMGAASHYQVIEIIKPKNDNGKLQVLVYEPSNTDAAKKNWDKNSYEQAFQDIIGHGNFDISYAKNNRACQGGDGACGIITAGIFAACATGNQKIAENLNINEKPDEYNKQVLEYRKVIANASIDFADNVLDASISEQDKKEPEFSPDYTIQLPAEQKPKMMLNDFNQWGSKIHKKNFKNFTSNIKKYVEEIDNNNNNNFNITEQYNITDRNNNIEFRKKNTEQGFDIKYDQEHQQSIYSFTNNELQHQYVSALIAKKDAENTTRDFNMQISQHGTVDTDSLKDMANLAIIGILVGLEPEVDEILMKKLKDATRFKKNKDYITLMNIDKIHGIVKDISDNTVDLAQIIQKTKQIIAQNTAQPSPKHQAY